MRAPCEFMARARMHSRMHRERIECAENGRAAYDKTRCAARRSNCSKTTASSVLHPPGQTHSAICPVPDRPCPTEDAQHFEVGSELVQTYQGKLGDAADASTPRFPA
jgi:hypothetical protein